MRNELRSIKKNRRYSEDFKRMLVKEYESGKYSVSQLHKLHQIAPKVIYDWIYKFSNFNDKSVRIVEMKESSQKKVKELEQRVKELERAVGLKQLNIDYLEKMLEIAKNDLGIDIKKNYNTPQSSGSEITGKQ